MKKHFEVNTLYSGTPEQIIEQMEARVEMFRGLTYTELNNWEPDKMIVTPIEPPADEPTIERIITAQDSTHPNYPHVRGTAQPGTR